MRLFYTTRSRCGRSAFTLIELMVVITIIAILVSLSAAATIRFIGVQQRNNTQTTVNKIYDRVNTSYKAYRNKFYTEPIPSTIHSYIVNTMEDPTDPNAEARARVIWIKMRYKQTFPTSFSEALNPAPLPPLPTYWAYLTQQRGITGSTPGTAAYESSACLVMALTQAQGGGGVNAEDLAGGHSVASFPVTTGTIPAFVDAWGTPLTFARWPTDSALLNPSGPQPGFNDPGDPLGFLANDNNGWLSTYGVTTYASLLHKLSPTDAYSYKLAPTIVSAGPDRQLGLDISTPPTSTLATLSPAAYDNIYSTTAP